MYQQLINITTYKGEYKSMRNNSKQYHKKQYTTVEKTKKIEGNNFKIAVDELVKASPIIKKIIGDLKEDATPTNVSAKLFNYIADNFPTIDENSNMQCSINLAANRCIIKTANRLSFGWKLKYNYNKQERKIYIEYIDIFITEFPEVDKDGNILYTVDATEENGWKIIHRD